MTTLKRINSKSCSTGEMMKYSLGSCTESLVINSFFTFSMLYYTKALGLRPELAAIAGSVAALWDGFSDPIMGHISDNTKSRFGKRHPYMLIGGVVMLLTFFFIWFVPDFFKTECVIGSKTISSNVMLFGYLVVMNLLLRTSYTVFIVPYTALGFEICDDYAGRSKVQGLKNVFNMTANMLGPATAWTIFFPNNMGDVKATQVASNYISMGMVFTVAAFIFLFLMLHFTKKYIKDSRQDKACHGNLGAFFRSMKEIVTDKYPRWVFIFMFFVLLGVVLISTLQMFVFDDFMQLDGYQKTIAHGGTMVGMGLGSLSLAFFVRRFDKKGAILIAVIWSVTCELILGLLFLTGFLKPDQEISGFPISFVLFSFLHGAYWFGNGIMMPTAISMMADISEIHQIKEGVDKNASYAAMFSLAMKISISVATLVAGYCLSWAGFQSGADVVQTPESVWRVCALTFLAGPVVSLLALLFICRYPVSEQFIEDLRVQYNREQE